ncbi:MAG: RNA polymerase sigma factor (sigma-70 family) [Planctomycetota bacterium]|jgi:RNA polymerase sigma factor (sigma-70 family)
MTWDTNTSILAQLETFSAGTAWGSLVTHFEPPLTRYAKRSGLSAGVVADVVQATLVAFAEGYRAGKYDRNRGRLSAWLYGILKREIASTRRKATLDPMEALDTARERELSTPEGELEAIWEEEWRRSILERSFERVRQEVEPLTWDSFAMQTFEQLSVDDVAERLGLPRTRVYNAKHRIMKRVRELVIEFEDA